jgi:hypothetical protein
MSNTDVMAFWFRGRLVSKTNGVVQQARIEPPLIGTQQQATAEAARREQLSIQQFPEHRVKVVAIADGVVPPIALHEINALAQALATARHVGTVLAEELAALRAEKSLEINPDIRRLTAQVVAEARAKVAQAQQEVLDEMAKHQIVTPVGGA